MTFSERYGYKSARQVVQLESIDEQSRTGLWNLLETMVWSHIHRTGSMRTGYYLSASGNEAIRQFCERLLTCPISSNQ
jgi:hypothetical protein